MVQSSSIVKYYCGICGVKGTALGTLTVDACKLCGRMPSICCRCHRQLANDINTARGTHVLFLVHNCDGK